MTTRRSDSDTRYHDDPYTSPLTGHYILHGAIIALFVLSPFLAWGFDFHPFRQSFHGYIMWGAAVVFAMLAYGPIQNAVEQQRLGFVLLYRRILSPVLMAVSTLALVATWVFAFYESYAGSVLN